MSTGKLIYIHEPQRIFEDLEKRSWGMAEIHSQEPCGDCKAFMLSTPEQLQARDLENQHKGFEAGRRSNGTNLNYDYVDFQDFQNKQSEQAK